MTMTAAETIGQTNPEVMDAIRRKDAAAVARCYTVNGAVLPPQSDLVAGTKAIEAFWAAGMQGGSAVAQARQVNAAVMIASTWISVVSSSGTPSTC